VQGIVVVLAFSGEYLCKLPLFCMGPDCYRGCCSGNGCRRGCFFQGRVVLEMVVLVRAGILGPEKSWPKPCCSRSD
jgi:hypothetical protein